MRKAFRIIPIIFSVLLCGCDFLNWNKQDTDTSDKTLVDISLSGMTTTYLQNSTFSFDGKCVAHFSDESYETVTPSSVSRPDMSLLGDQFVHVSYVYKQESKASSYKIFIFSPEDEENYPTSLTLAEMTTEYEVGDIFSFDGVATVTYTDGSSKVVTQVSTSSPDMSTAGEKDVTVRYTEGLITVSNSYTINVKEKSVDPGDDDDPEEYCGYITLSERNLEIELSSTKKTYLTVNFIDCELEYDVTWASSDEDVALVSQYGGVYSAKKNTGTAVITCTTASGKSAKCVVRVVTKIEPKTERYCLVTDLSSLDVGDIIVIASPQNGVTASNDNLHMKLNPVTTKFSSDYSYITQLGNDTAEFILSTDGKGEGFTLENQNNQYLASTHEGKVTFVNNKGNIHWDIYGNEYDDITDAVIDSEVETHGYFMFNIKQNYFTTYLDSSIQPGLLVLPKIYRLTYI